MHGDIKPENILIDHHNSIKIGDVDFVVRYFNYNIGKMSLKVRG